LRGLNVPAEIYDLEAAKEGVDPDNIKEFRLWFRQFNKDLHPLPLSAILMKQYDGAIIDSTIAKNGDPEPPALAVGI